MVLRVISGGGCSTNDGATFCSSKAKDNGSKISAGAIATASCPTTATAVFKYACEGRTSVRQHECEAAIRIEPHCFAIRRQHSCSAGVRAELGNMHAMAGPPSSVSTRRIAANLPALRNTNSLLAEGAGSQLH